MGTTLTVDDDLAEARNREARPTGRSFNHVVDQIDCEPFNDQRRSTTIKGRSVILPDVTLPVYVYKAIALLHLYAKAWWERCSRGRQPVAIPWVAALFSTSCRAGWSAHRYASCSLALENQAMVQVNDSNFNRFPGLRWSNPLTNALIT